MAQGIMKRPALIVAFACSLPILIWAGVGRATTNSWLQAIRWMNGHRVFLEPEEQTLTARNADGTTSCNLRVINTGKPPVVLTGMVASCGCITATNLPLSVAAHSSVSLPLAIQATANDEDLEFTVILYTSGSPAIIGPARLVLKARSGTAIEVKPRPDPISEVSSNTGRSLAK
jgi:hypothetical protein